VKVADISGKKEGISKNRINELVTHTKNKYEYIRDLYRGIN
jgi:hypothetical protein